MTNLSPSANLTLQWAEKYISLGWSLIPLKPRSKEPLITWQGYQTQKASIQQVQDWLLKWPEMNLGVVTGAISQIVVVDLDGTVGMLYGRKNAAQSSVASITGNGKQVFYKWTEHVDNSVKKVAPGVDIRGDGGYVVVCPSIHPNGKRYRWERFNPNVLSTLPMSVVNRNVSSTTVPQVGVGKPDGWIAKAAGGMKIGTIDNDLTSILGRMRHDGWTEQDALVVMEPLAREKGATEGHVADKIKNVWGRYEPKASLSKPGVSEWGRAQSLHTPSQRLVLHSPTNPDSLIEYNRRTSTVESTEKLSTGYSAFDTLTKGLRKGEVLTVAARTGVGKTNWILTPIRQFCNSGGKVLLFSTEMSFDQIWQRYQSTLSQNDDFRLHQFYICDEFTPDIERIEEAIKNVQPDLFVFDHISHIGTDYHIISKFMSEIKRLARLFNIPAIVTAQLNRNADYVEAGARIEPRLSMIQGSDQIGQMSAQVLLLNEKRVVNGETEIEGIVVKNRHGDRGMIQFILKREPYRMEESV